MAFLDRDGTLVEERGYLRRVEDLVLLPGAAPALRHLAARGIAAVLVTNQSGPARGFYGSDHVDALHRRLVACLAAEGVALDGIYACCHLPPEEGGVDHGWGVHCRCRKPAAGLVERAVVDLDLDLDGAVVVGDKPADLGLAQRIGARSVLVRTGFGRQTEDDAGAPRPWAVADDVAAAVALAYP